MKLSLISSLSKENRKPSNPWSWLKAVLIGSHEVLFEGNVLLWLNEVFPYLMKYRFERWSEEDINLIIEIYKIFRMVPPGPIYYDDMFSMKSDININKEPKINIEQTSDYPSLQDSDTGQREFDDHFDHSLFVL